MIRSLGERFSRRRLFGGPCLIINRHSGLALDSTTSPQARSRPVLWTPHALPWQQWRIVAAGQGRCKVVSEHAQRVLTTDPSARDGSWVWLERDCNRPEQTWKLTRTEDSLGFLVEAARSEVGLDGTLDPKIPAANDGGSVDDPTTAFLWSTRCALATVDDSASSYELSASAWSTAACFSSTPSDRPQYGCQFSGMTAVVHIQGCPKRALFRVRCDARDPERAFIWRRFTRSQVPASAMRRTKLLAHATASSTVGKTSSPPAAST